MAAPFVLDAALRIQKIEGLDALKKEIAGITSSLSFNAPTGGGGGVAGGASIGVAASNSLDALGAVASVASKALQQVVSASEAVVAAFSKVSASAATVATTPAAGAGAIEASFAKSAVVAQQAIVAAGAEIATAASAVAAKIAQSTNEFPFATPAISIPGGKAGIAAGGGVPFANQNNQAAQDLQAALDAKFGPGFQLGVGGAAQGPQLPPHLNPSFPFANANQTEIQIPGPKIPAPNAFAAQQQAQFQADLQQQVAAAAQSQIGGAGVKPGGGFVSFAGGGDEVNKLAEGGKKAAAALEQTGAAAAKAGSAAKAAMAGAGTATEKFADQILLATKRNAAFFIGTGATFAAIAGLKVATDEVIEFDKQMVRLDQTLDPTKADLASIKSEIISLSTATGTSATELAKTAVTLAQAGFRSAQLKDALGELANVPLLASFDGIDQAATGIIAIFGQFGDKAGSVREVLDKLNQVSNDYAITAADLIEAVKRGGGAFSALGGNLDQFIALVTAAKQTTQESAESIGTGLRTIFAKLGKADTLEFLKGIGVQTTDASGKLLGMFEILKQTADVFKASPDNKKRDIAEQLGGLRQIGRIISVLDNFDLVTKALNTSLASSGSVAQDVAKGTSSLSKQFDILKAKATELVLALAPDVFVPFLQFLTTAGTSAVKLATALGPLLKVLLALGTAAAALKGIELVGSLAARLLPLAGAGAAATAGGGSALGGGLLGALGLGGLATRNLSLAGAGAGLLPSATQEPGGQMLFPFAGRGIGSRAAEGAGNFFGSPGVQVATLAAVATLGPNLVKLAASSLGASDALSDMAAKTVRTATILVGILSVLQRQSIGQTLRGGGFNGFIGGGLAGGAATLLRGAAGLGAIGITAALAAKDVVQEEIAKKLDEVAEAIKNIEVPDAKNNPKVQEATEHLTDQIDKALNVDLDKFSGFTGNAAGLGQRISNVFGGLASLDLNRVGAGFNPNTPDVDFQKQLDDLIGSNLGLLQSLIENAIRQGGDDFRGTLARNLESQLSAQGKLFPTDFGQIITDTIFKKAGGFPAVAQAIAKVRADLERSGLAEEAQKVARSLASVIVPPELFGQIASFGKAVEAVSKRIDASVASFEGQVPTVEGINAPKLPTSVSKEAAQKLLANGSLAGLSSASPQFQQNAKTAQEAFDLATKFSIAISNSASKFKQSPTGNQNPLTEGLDKSIGQFFDVEKTPKELRGKLTQLLKDIAEAIKTGADLDNAGLNPDKVKELLKKHLGDILPTSDNIAEITATQLDASLRLISRRGDFQADILKRQVNAPQNIPSQFNTTKSLLEKAGVGLNANQTDQILGDTGLIGRLSAALQANTKDLGDVSSALHNSALTGEAPTLNGQQVTIPDLLKRFEDLRDKSLTLQAAMESLTKSVGQVDQQNSDFASQQKRVNDVVQDLSTQQEKIRKVLLQPQGAAATPEDQRAQNKQTELIQQTFGLNQKVIDAGKAFLAEPSSFEKLQGFEKAVIDFKTQIVGINQQRINQKDFPGEINFAGISGGLAETIDNIGKLSSEILEGKLTAKQEADKKDAEKLTEAIQQLKIQQTEQIASQTGLLDDPFGSKTFKEAVDKFTTTIDVFAKGGVPQPNVDAQGRAIAGQLTGADSNALERSLFGGQTRQGIVSLAGGLLAGPRNPLGGGINSLDALLNQTGDAREQGIGTLSQTLTDQLSNSGPVDPQTAFRISQALRSQGRVGLDQFQITDQVRNNALQFNGSLRPTLNPADAIQQNRPGAQNQITPQPNNANVPNFDEIILKKLSESENANNGGTDTSQASTIDVPGLSENTETLKGVGEGQDALASTLQDTAKAIREGVGVKVEAVQNVSVKVEGLAEDIETQLRPVLEEAVKRVATNIVRQTLVDLASSSDAEGAQAFNAAARNLG